VKIPFARVVCDGHEQAYVEQVLKSGWLTTAGRAHEFERRFAAAIGAPYACAVNSCTAALHLALEALGVKEGEKVLVPTWTFTATAEVVRYLGADPVFLDVDYGTGLLTPETVADGLDRHPDAKVLMVVHFCGQAAEMLRPDGTGILDICRRRGVRVVEDAAHAFPARRGGRLVGGSGDIVCFSFYANKTITTGEGGMLITFDEALWRRSKIMRLHGIDRDVWNRFTSDKPSWEYDVVAPGYKYNMPDINAAVGLAQLERAEDLRRGRQRCAEHYYRELEDVACLDLPVLEVAPEDHAWHLFPIVLTQDAPISRDRLIELLAKRGIGTSVHYKPIHRLSYYRDRYELRPEQFPNAERLWRGCLSLPIYASLTDEELRFITDAIRDLLSPCKGRASSHAAEPSPFSAPAALSHDEPHVSRVSAGAAFGPGPDQARPRIHISVPHMGGSEERYVREAFSSNWLSTIGPNVTALEQAFTERIGRPAVAVASGTAAIHLGLRLLGVKEDDEVVSPTLTFVASCNPIRYLGATPVFIDAERATWNMDPQLFVDWMTARAACGCLPKAAVLVHLFGHATDMAPIVEVCRRYGVPILEDAAESLGATYQGRQVGMFGDVSVFSFNGNKVITATAGGMLLSPRQDWVDKARHWSTQACDPDPIRNYVHSEIGHNYRMSNVLAGIARGQLEVLDLRIQQRRAVFERYCEAFADMPGIEPQPEADFGDRCVGASVGGASVGGAPVRRCAGASVQQGAEGQGGRGGDVQRSTLNAQQRSAESSDLSAAPLPLAASPSAPLSLHTRWLSCFLIDESKFGMSSADLIRFLDAANIESRPVWKPMHTQPLYRRYECVGGEVAADLNRRGICLPSSSSLSAEDQQFVIERIRQAHVSAKHRKGQ